MGEFDLIARIRERAATRDDVLLGIGDDAALLLASAGQTLVVTTDTLNAGVHFAVDVNAGDIGWKGLAVNLSDLAAMGAEPAWCTLSLSLPQADGAWLDAFLDGFLELAARHRVALVGGDITRGPLSIAVTALGQVPPDSALRRDTAQVDDDIWVTGTLGDAAAALALSTTTTPRARGGLDRHLHRPDPRVAHGMALRGLAHACIDVSDGLLADLGHVLRASGVGAQIELARLPASPQLAALATRAQRWPWQLAGGDDYELCFTAAQAQRDAIVASFSGLAVPAAVIGRVRAGTELRVLDPDGVDYQPAARGWDHFVEAAG